MPKRPHVPIPVTGVDHIAIAVPDLDIAIGLLRSKFGISVGTPKAVRNQNVRIAYADLGNVKLEVVEPLSAASPVTSFLEKRPLGGLHHICFTVTNAHQAHTDATAQGITTTGPPHPGHHGRPLFFLSPQETCGVLTEIENGEKMP